MHRILIALCCLPLLEAAPPAHFVEHSVASDLKGGYQVVVADLNHDGKPDLIALGTGMSELVWYENPTWQRHVIVSGVAHLINCVPVEVAGDPIPQIVLAHEFANQAKNSIGIVSVLRHQGDPREPWSITEIDRLTTSHRLRLADIDGSGKRVVLNQPLTGPKAEAPEYRDQAPLVFYRPSEWKRQTISTEDSGVVHGIFVVDWDGNGRDDILTASFVGIHLYRFGKDGHWTRTEIAKGNPDPWPKSGTSDIAVGHLAKSRFLATIEPWHGEQVAVYRQQDGKWNRQVIDTSLVDGHTIAAADLNADGSDEIVASFRGKGGSVYLYYADDATGEHWSRQILDNAMAGAACTVADLNADGHRDIVCIGAAKLKWYENAGR